MSMLREKMTIRNGKFYKNNVEVPIEHGNKEQIELLKRVEEMQEGFDPDDIKITKRINIEFNCVCGATNDFNDFTELDVDDPETLIAGETCSCHYCGLRFKLITFKTQYDEYLQLKLISKDGQTTKE